MRTCFAIFLLTVGCMSESNGSTAEAPTSIVRAQRAEPQYGGRHCVHADANVHRLSFRHRPKGVGTGGSLHEYPDGDTIRALSAATATRDSFLTVAAMHGHGGGMTVATHLSSYGGAIAV
jgi:hypothetical protein